MGPEEPNEDVDARESQTLRQDWQASFIGHRRVVTPDRARNGGGGQSAFGVGRERVDLVDFDLFDFGDLRFDPLSLGRVGAALFRRALSRDRGPPLRPSEPSRPFFRLRFAAVPLSRLIFMR